jgi:beta-glucosidase
LIAAHRRYKLPVYVTENGFGANETLDATGGVHDPGRIAYLHAYTKAMEQAAAAGVDVRGYFIWSLLDNFEWGSGYASRFGIVFVDYATQKRTPKSSFEWFAKLIRANQGDQP